MVKVKICGITTVEDAISAIECGADALGFVFAVSPRQVQPETVRRIVSELPPLVTKVGVFVDWTLERVIETMRYCGLDLAQLHGSESPEYCRALYPRVLKAFTVRSEIDLLRLPEFPVAGYILDRPKTSSGESTGESYDWRLARKASRYGPVLIAGNLNPDNVADAIAAAEPYGVDVASGVESKPGRKDKAKMKAFIQAVRACQTCTSATHQFQSVPRIGAKRF